jgi:hypothetical protein
MLRHLIIVPLVATCLLSAVIAPGLDIALAAPAQSVGVVVPPPDLWPFSVMQRHVTGITATDYRLDFFRPAQPNPANPTNPTGHAILTGNQGKTAYDQRLLYAAMNDSCAPNATYCASTPYPSGKLTNETFRGLQVGDGPATVSHIICCNGHHWSVLWYSAALDTTYELLLSQDVADEISASELGEGNRPAAESVASIAARLVPLR